MKRLLLALLLLARPAAAQDAVIWAETPPGDTMPITGTCPPGYHYQLYYFNGSTIDANVCLLETPHQYPKLFSGWGDTEGESERTDTPTARALQELAPVAPDPLGN
jgi:hypothetical protein